MDAVIRSVRRLCDAGLDSVTLRREVPVRLAPAIGFDAYAFCTCDPDTGLISHVVAHGVSHGLADAYVERVYPQLRARQAEYSPVLDRTPPTMLPPWRESTTASERCASDAQLHVPLVARGRLWGTLWLVRLGGGWTHSNRSWALMTRLVPHLVRGVQTATRVDRTAADTAGSAEPGVLALDERNRAMMRTPAAAAWLDDLADVGLRMPDDLPLAVAALAAHARGAYGGEAHVRAQGRSGRWYLLRASLAEPCAGARATVVIVRPATPREVATSLIRLHALSTREHEIVAAVARGESTKEIAAALGRSPHTVCEHIGRACQKLGVRGRKALVAKLFIGVESASNGGARRPDYTVAPRCVPDLIPARTADLGCSHR